MNWKLATLLTAGLLCVPISSSAVETITNAYDALVFEAETSESRHPQRVITHYVCEDLYINCFLDEPEQHMGGLFAVLQTDRPLGAVAQFARFKVKSEGYLPSAGHFGTILNIGLDFDPSAAIGRGLIVGNVSGRPDGCQTAPPKSQFQLWWHNTEDPPVPDSHLAPKSCSSFTWQDNTWYEVELYVDSSRDLYYSVSDQAGTKLYSSAIRENRTPGMTDDSGFGFFATDQNAPVSGEQWRLSFLDIKIGWSDELLY